MGSFTLAHAAQVIFIVVLIFLFFFQLYGGWSSENLVIPAPTDRVYQENSVESALLRESSTYGTANSTRTAIAPWTDTKSLQSTPATSTASKPISTPIKVPKPLSPSTNMSPTVAYHGLATQPVKGASDMEKTIIPTEDDSRAVVIAKQQNEDARWVEEELPE